MPWRFMGHDCSSGPLRTHLVVAATLRTCARRMAAQRLERCATSQRSVRRERGRRRRMEHQLRLGAGPKRPDELCPGMGARKLPHDQQSRCAQGRADRPTRVRSHSHRSLRCRGPELRGGGPLWWRLARDTSSLDDPRVKTGHPAAAWVTSGIGARPGNRQAMLAVVGRRGVAPPRRWYCLDAVGRCRVGCPALHVTPQPVVALEPSEV
jgi:hypothetical protein